jgi:hypothetical protein
VVIRFFLLTLGGIGFMTLLFFLVMRQLRSRGNALTEMATKIDTLNARFDAVGPTHPFFKHVENTFSDILHHDNEEDAPMDRLLEQLKKAPAEPMPKEDRAELKELLDVRANDQRRSERERKVAGMMGEMMDMALEEEEDESPIGDSKMVGHKAEKSPE